VIAIAGAALSAGAAVVGAGIAAVGALGIGTGTLLSIAATVALVGVEYLMRPSTGGQPQLAPPQTGASSVPARKTLRQADMPRCFIFGRERVPGAFFLYETDGYYLTNAATGALNLYQGIYICDGPIDGFDAFICDDETPPIVRTSADARISDGTSDSNTFGFYNGLKSSGPSGSLNGGASNTLSGYYAAAFAPINATEAGAFPTLFTDTFTAIMTDVWPTTCVGKGVTAVYTWASTLKLSASARPVRFPAGFPEWSFCVRGARVYDPRDASQTETENGVWTLYNTTWKWTENPALIAAHFIRWLVNENLTAVTGVDWDSIADAANDCDAVVAATMRVIDGGAQGAASEPFARMAGVYYLNTPPREFLSKIMAACDGSYSIDQSGRFAMWIGKWEEPAVTFDETDVSAFVEEFVAPTSESVNEIHSKYVEPQNAYQLYEATVWTDDASIASVGRRIATIPYELVPSPNQAYRLSQRYARRINGKRKLEVTIGPRGMLAFKQRVIGIYLPRFGIEQSTWRVEALKPDGNLTRWRATLRELTTDIFDDDAAPMDPAQALKVVSAFTPSAPSGLDLARYDGSTSGTGYVVISLNTQHQNDPTVAQAQLTTAGLVQEQTLLFSVEYSTDGGFSYAPATIYLSNYIVRTPDLSVGTIVDVQARFMNADGTFSAYSSTYTIGI
jgi:hypothetical protein